MKRIGMLSKKAFAESRAPIKCFGDALLEAGREFPRIVAVSTDSSSGSGLTPFKQAFPDRHVEFGIMEQGALGYCAGMATTGVIPFYVAIAPFVTARPFEMFKNDLGYMNQNVKVVGRCCGLTYSQLGPTHHSIDDVALLRTIPGVTILSPGDPVSIVKATEALARTEGPAYMRIGSPNMPVLYDEDLPFEIGKGILVRDGKDLCLIGSGTALASTVKAADILEARGISVRVIDIHTIKPLDEDIILEAARDIGKIVTVEEHFVNGGLGSAIAQLLSQRLPTPMKIIGVEDHFVSNGPYDALLGMNGLLPEQIAATAVSFLSGI
ncbi:MAG: transketolase C-terminal domain-containing protein [Rectinemataceae bacterium]